MQVHTQKRYSLLEKLNCLCLWLNIPHYAGDETQIISTKFALKHFLLPENFNKYELHDVTAVCLLLKKSLL